MDTFNSIFAPLSAAAKHLSHALHRVQDDFQSQAKKSRKVVKRDLGAARSDLNEAMSRFGDATDHLRDTISTTKAEYADSLRDKYQIGADYAKSLRARANSLTVPNIDTYVDRRHLTRNNALIAGAVVGVGYVIFLTLKKLRANARVDDEAAGADEVVRTPRPRRKKRAARGEKTAAAANSSVPASQRPN